MKPRLAALTLAVLLVVNASGIAFARSDEIADDFSSGDYSGSTGGEGWLGSWREKNESNGPDAGSVQVKADNACHDGECLVIAPLLGVLDVGAHRKIDLRGATSAELRYRLDFGGGVNLNGTVEVYATVDGGGPIDIHSHEGNDDGHFSFDLPLGDTVDLFFAATGIAVAPSAAVDDIEIRVERSDPTTTTTTTTTSTTSTTTTTTTTPSTTTTPPTTTTTTTSATKPRPTTTTSVPAPKPAPSTARTSITTTTTTTTTTDRPTSSPTTSSPPDVPTTDVPTTDMEVMSAPPPVITGEPPSATEGVVTDVDPGLAPSGPRLEAQEDLLVRFGLAAEDIGLDILGNAVLGLVLGWAWLKRES